MKQIKSFLQKLTKKDSGSSEVMGPKQGNSPVDQGETPPSERVSDASVERDLHKEFCERMEKKKIMKACDVVEKVLQKPTFAKNHANLGFSYDDFPDDINAELVLVGLLAECVSDWLELTREQKHKVVYQTKLKKLDELQENGTIERESGRDCNWHEPLDGTAKVLTGDPTSVSASIEPAAEPVEASSVYSEHRSDDQVDEPAVITCAPSDGDKFNWSSPWEKIRLFVKKSDVSDATTKTSFKEKVAKVFKKKEKSEASDAPKTSFKEKVAKAFKKKEKSEESDPTTEASFKEKVAKVFRKKEKSHTSDAAETRFKDKVVKLWRRKEKSHTKVHRSIVPNFRARVDYNTEVRDVYWDRLRGPEVQFGRYDENDAWAAWEAYYPSPEPVKIWQLEVGWESDDDLCGYMTNRDPTGGSSKQVSKAGPFDKLSSKVKNRVSEFKRKRQKLQKVSQLEVRSKYSASGRNESRKFGHSLSPRHVKQWNDEHAFHLTQIAHYYKMMRTDIKNPKSRSKKIINNFSSCQRKEKKTVRFAEPDDGHE